MNTTTINLDDDIILPTNFLGEIIYLKQMIIHIIKNHKTINVKQELNSLRRQIKFWQLSRKKL